MLVMNQEAAMLPECKLVYAWSCPKPTSQPLRFNSCAAARHDAAVCTCCPIGRCYGGA